jgi:hypothetical protein
LNQAQITAMGLSQFAGYGEAKAGTAAAARAGKGLEQTRAQALWHARAIIDQLNNEHGAIPLKADTDPAADFRLGRRLNGLAGIAQQIEQDAMELVWVGLHLILSAQHGLKLNTVR